MRAQRQRREHPHAALVKQAIKQTFAGQLRIDQLDVFDGCDHRLAFDPRIVFRYGMRNRAFRRIARMQIGLPRPLRRLRQELQQHAAGEYYERLVREVAKLLAEATELGAAYRVDLRLRPQGAAGPTAVAIDAAFHYYDTSGRT